MTADLTVFVATWNRQDTLLRCIHLLERQRMPKRIVIVDNGTSDSAALLLLDRLAERYTVYRMPPIEEVPAQAGDDDEHGGQPMMAVQRNVEEAFRREWETQPRPRWFGMTDADVHLDGPVDSLDAYVSLAEKTGRAVGPHLRLNVGRNYPLRSCALIQHARVLFRQRMRWVDGIPHSDDPIDTTFHLFPAAPAFPRLRMETYRVGPPWWATHSDWLIDVDHPTAENFSYIRNCGDAASWGGRWLKGMFEAYIRSPEDAYELISQIRPWQNDYFHEGFMLSWMLQYGRGCDQDVELSKIVLRNAVPDWSPCWEFEPCWDALVYDDDQSCLGWDV